MANITATTDGSWTLQDTELALQEFEGTGAEFVETYVVISATGPVNKHTYNNLPPGKLPSKRVQLQLASAALATGATQIWGGAMLVDGNSRQVIAFR